VSVVSAASGSLEIGVAKSNSTYGGAGQIEYQSNTGEIFVEGVLDSTGSTYTSGDLIGVAYNADDDEITFYKNNVSQGVVSLSGFAGSLVAPMVMDRSSSAFTVEFNFGQRPFAHAAPSGFKALCTQNLPDPTIADGGDYFNAILYTGDGTNPRSFTGVGFQPDLVVAKRRNATGSIWWIDSVRGTQRMLASDSTNAEDVNSANGSIESFDADGFTTEGSSTNGNLNNNTNTYVAWNWNAGGSNATNTDGTITSTVRANPTAGFSIVSYTGNGSTNQTVGHGLGVKPKLKITKSRSITEQWVVTGELIGGTDYRIFLQSTAAVGTAAGFYPADTSTTLGISGSNVSDGHNQNGVTYISYCFAEVDGYSKFGSYTGNGSTDGPFVYCGFRPAFIMIKRTNDTGNWFTFDNDRIGYNTENYRIQINDNGTEADPGEFDILSNGFKVRFTSVNVNASASTYIFMAFAENPFKYSLAR
jgi:hypothetical protein